MQVKSQKRILLLCSLLSLLLMAACGAGGGGSDDSAEVTPIEIPTTSLDIELTLPDDEEFLEETIANVDRVTVDVLQGDEVLISGVELVNEGGVWTGTLDEVPIGIDYTLVTHALDESGEEVFELDAEETTSEETQEAVRFFPRRRPVQVRAEVNESTARTNSLIAQAEPNEITQVFALVQDGSTIVVPETELRKVNNQFAWQRILRRLPVRTPLFFSARGVNDDGFDIFTGATTQTLGFIFPLRVTIDMTRNEPVQQFLNITQINFPDPIETNSTDNTVLVSVQGNTLESVRYDFSASGGGSFAIATTTTKLSFFGEQTFANTYNAPSIPGNYLNSVTVTSLDRGLVVQNDFITNVVFPETNVAVKVLINPVITNMAVLQETDGSSSDIIFAPTLFEIGEEFDYNWSFNAATTGTIAATNFPQATILNYNPSIAGTLVLEVNVKNAPERKTTLQYGVPEDLFPTNVIQTF